MKFRLSLLTWITVLVAACSPAFASGSGDRTQFGHDITVGTDEQVSDATCFGCTVRVRGHVDGDVTTFGGSIVVEHDGVIGGDTTAFAGTVRLDAGSSVKAVSVFGGRVRRDSQATVDGDVTTFGGGGSLWLFIIFGLPFLVLGSLIALIVWLVRRFTRPRMPMPARV